MATSAGVTASGRRTETKDDGQRGTEIGGSEGKVLGHANSFLGSSELSTPFRLQAMKREANLHELKALDEARKHYLQHQHAVKELELRKMDREIQKKVRNTSPSMPCLAFQPLIRFCPIDSTA